MQYGMSDKSLQRVFHLTLRVAILGPGMQEAVSGGAERHTRSLVHNLAEWGVKILWASVDGIPKYAGNLTTVRAVSFKASPAPSTLAMPTIGALSLARAVRKFEPDIVHAQMVGAPYGLAGAFLSRDYPLVLTVHSLLKTRIRLTNVVSWPHDYIWSLLEKYEFRKARVIVAVSPALRDCLRGMILENVEMIPNCVDDRFFLESNRVASPKLVYLGRVHPIKNLEVLLKAVSRIEEKWDPRLTIAGPVDDRRYLRKLIALASSLEVAHLVHFVSKPLNDEEIANLFREASIFVLPSFHETFGIALLEAMASGICVLVSRGANSSGIITNGRNGLVFDERDYATLVNSIEQLIRDENLFKSIARGGRVSAARYRWSNTVQRYLRLYDRIASQGGLA